ncbi:MAG: aspartate-semialdehyde dehydrogenase, partial [Marinilabiliales bacterium]
VLIPVATKKSAGKIVKFKGNEYIVVSAEDAINQKPDIALFSAGGNASRELAPKFADAGCKVIDNSSAWRMAEDIKLIVPEINAHLLQRDDMIIANPNCSTIQLLLPLASLHKKYRIKRIVVSTYQSVTGTGNKAVLQMENERNNINGEMAYPYRIDMNCLPHCDSFTENAYTKEEMKLLNETQKILDENILVSATAVRVPVVGGHGESVNVEFQREPDLEEIKEILSNSEGLVLKDKPEQLLYPTQLDSHNRDEVFVGRIRKDLSNSKAINMWIVADNLRKGAATNAVQVAEYLVDNDLL